MPGAPPSLRIDGQVVPLMEGPLGGEEIEDAVVPALAPHARKHYREARIADGSFRTPDLGRFRINLHHERGRPPRRSAACPAWCRASPRSTCRRRSKR